MQLTKFTHACLVLEEQGQRLVIDPGIWTEDLQDFSNIVGVVITHAHADHLSTEHVAAILSANPTVKIYSTAEVVEQLQSPLAIAVRSGGEESCGLFKLRFFGDKHELVHDNLPQMQNIGVLVNDNLYYPGDSFTVPSATNITTLALPVGAPWLKIGESIDFLSAVKPMLCFPTHDAILSEKGNSSADAWLDQWCEQNRVRYKRLAPTETMAIS